MQGIRVAKRVHLDRFYYNLMRPEHRESTMRGSTNITITLLYLVEKGRCLGHEEEREGRQEGRDGADDQKQPPVDKVQGADVKADGGGGSRTQQPPGKKRWTGRQ